MRLHHIGWSGQTLQRVCQAAERSGYDGFSLYDVPSQPALECWTALSYCLASTERAIGVPLVLANPLRNPALVAKMAVDLQVLSGGRLVLGLGAGGSDEDLRAYGLDAMSMGTRLGYLEEALDVIRQLMAGHNVSHQGSHYVVERLRLEPPPVPPPILVGGHGERLLDLAARYADVVNVGFGMTEKEWSRIQRRLKAKRSQGPLQESGLLFSHNVAVPETGEFVPTMLERLYLVGVSWFFLLFPDLPETASLERFAELVLPGLRSRLGGLDFPSRTASGGADDGVS